jgi:stress-induced-phosphoprotein 1
LQAGHTTQAIDLYSQAIRLDSANHIYYSNRSAAYLKKGDAHNALEDATTCVNLAPDFAKGYSRKGAALHALQRYNDSMAAYQEGLKRFPDDAGLQKGLADVQREKEGPVRSSSGGGGMSGLFGPEMMAQMALDPRLRPYLNDPETMTKIQMIQKNPNLLTTMLQDPKIMAILTAMMGGGMDDNDDPPPPSRSATRDPPGTTSRTTAAPMNVDATGGESKEDGPVEVEEKDWSDLPEAERQKKEQQKAAQVKKEEGNQLYKSQKLDDALAKYDEAISLDPTNMTFLNNKAAVYFTQKKYDECIDMCMKAVEVGKENRAPFEDRAKALTRAAKAYQKKGDLTNAIQMCAQAQLESFDKETQRLMKTMELEKKKADALSYQDEEKAEEAKQRGNEHFRNQKWVEAVQEYEEAVKRAPKNAAIRNNLAAALCKIMDFTGAKRQVEEAIALDPTYVKAWARKGDIEMYNREYHKAMESYKEGLSLDENNTACKDGLRKCIMQINYGRASMTEEEKKLQAEHAMADPEIQSILTDPVIQQILRDFNENPAAAQKAMNDPTVRAKINKLIASGIIETR